MARWQHYLLLREWEVQHLDIFMYKSDTLDVNWLFNVVEGSAMGRFELASALTIDYHTSVSMVTTDSTVQ